MPDVTAPQISVALIGPPKSGKTHLACTFPEPIYYVSLDLGTKWLIEHKFADRKIVLHQYAVPVIDTLSPKPYAEPIVDQIKADYKTAIESGEFNTFVVDTGTMLRDLIIQWFKERCAKQKLMPRDYGEPNILSAWFMQAPIYAGKNMVSIHHIKEKYVNDKATGEFILDGYQGIPGIADYIVSMEFNRASKKNTATIEFCRFERGISGMKQDDCTYTDLVALAGIGG